MTCSSQDFPELPARIAVTGAGGQLGSQLCRALGNRAIPLDYPDFDLTQADTIARALRQLKPHVLINTAAYTAVDRAEDEPEKCFAVNAVGVQQLAQHTCDVHCALVQLSTDYVFGSQRPADRPHREDDPTEPQGVYARSKWEGEQMARVHPQHLIVRTCGLYGAPGPTSASNFVTTMLRLGREKPQVSVVNDQTCCPTWTVELSDALLWLIRTRQHGTFHVVNRGRTSWYQFAQKIFELAQIECPVVPITTRQYNARAPRPVDSALDTAKYAATGGPPMSTWDEALAEFLRRSCAA